MRREIILSISGYLIFILLSCNIKYTEHDCNLSCIETIIIKISEEEILDFNPKMLFDHFDLIQLENDKNALVGNIKKFTVCDSLILILDDTRKVLQKFTIRGQYLGQVGNIGRAQGEYLQLFDYQADGDTLILWDYRQRKMIYYTLCGSFLKEYPLNDYFLSFVKLDGEYWAYTAGINEESNGKGGFNLRQYRNGLTSIESIDFFPASSFYPRTLNKTNFFKHDESAIFSFGLSNTIYRIINSDVFPYICVDAGKRSIQYNHIKNQFSSMQQCAEFLSKSDYVGIISDLIESERFIYFNVQEINSGTIIHIIYDKDNRNALRYRDVVNDDPTVFVSGDLLFFDDSYFYFALPSYYFDFPGIEDFVIQNSISEHYAITDYSTVIVRAKLKDKPQI